MLVFEMVVFEIAILKGLILKYQETLAFAHQSFKKLVKQKTSIKLFSLSVYSLLSIYGRLLLRDAVNITAAVDNLTGCDTYNFMVWEHARDLL